MMRYRLMPVLLTLALLQPGVSAQQRGAPHAQAQQRGATQAVQTPQPARWHASHICQGQDNQDE